MGNSARVVQGERKACNVVPLEMSQLEESFAFQLKAYKIPYVREVQFARPRRFRFDFVIPENRVGALAVEINGGQWVKSGHSTGKGLQRDADKAYEALKHGYRLLTLTGDDVQSGTGIDKVLSLL